MLTVAVVGSQTAFTHVNLWVCVSLKTQWLQWSIAAWHLQRLRGLKFTSFLLPGIVLALALCVSWRGQFSKLKEGKQAFSANTCKCFGADLISLFEVFPSESSQVSVPLFTVDVGVWRRGNSKPGQAAALSWEVLGFLTATELVKVPEVEYRWRFYKRKKRKGSACPVVHVSPRNWICPMPDVCFHEHA